MRGFNADMGQKDFFEIGSIYLAPNIIQRRGGMLDILRQRFERSCQKTDLIAEVPRGDC